MNGWRWLTEGVYGRLFVVRVVAKAIVLFVLVNVVFGLFSPIEALGRLSVYNWLVPGRERLPYGENAQSANLSLYSVPAMLHAHSLLGAWDEGDYRVVLIGDSATWGYLLRPDETLAGQLNAGGWEVNGQRLRAYNLGYPTMSLTKDLMLLEAALAAQPDAVVWLFTAESFPRAAQLEPALVQNNAARVRRLIDSYNLALDSGDSRLVERTLVERTLVGERRALADWLRLQLYGFAWATTGIDQYYPPTYTPRQSDFAPDVTWHSFSEPQPLTDADLAFDVLAAGIQMTDAAGIPLLLVNEPMFISSGENSDLRYNFFYPRWAYDGWRARLIASAEQGGWRLLDVWDAVAPDAFTDSPVHMTPAGTRLLAEQVGAALAETPPER